MCSYFGYLISFRAKFLDQVSHLSFQKLSAFSINKLPRQGTDKQTKDLLLSVLKKHHHQTQRRWGTQGTPKNSTQATGGGSVGLVGQQ